MIKDKKTYSILVVEDNPGDFAIVEDFLAEQILNPLISHATRFKQALAYLSEKENQFDVILLDLTLPDKSGQDLITQMLLVSYSCPIIVLTGYSDIDFSIMSISQGVSDYLLKEDLNAFILYKSIIYSCERKKAISQLQDSEKRYSDLFHLSPQPMCVFDQETFRFTQVNKAAIELYGYSEEEFLNMGILDIKPEEDVFETRERLMKISPDEGIFKRTITHQKKSGEIIEVEIYSTPITINNKSFVSVIAIDVTEKKIHEHAILKAIIKTQEDERYEIGGELHDNVCQILAASQLNLGMLKKSLSPPGMNSFSDCRENINLALDEIRNLSHRLAPAFFDDSTMEETFARLFNTFNLDKKLEIFIHFDGAMKKYPLTLDLQLNLYRILQEQLKNILKYANATVVEVDVLIHKNRLTMRVSDNGVGFKVEALKREGIGLANMRRRAESFSGKFEIYSSPGDGCEIIIDIPFKTVE